MAELKIFYKDKDKDKIKVGRSVNILSSLDKSDIIWIDLLDVSDRTEGVLEDFLKIDIQEDEEMECHKVYLEKNLGDWNNQLQEICDVIYLKEDK